MEYFACTEGNAGPIIDVIWGSLNVVSAIAIAADPDTYYYYYGSETGIAVGILWGVVSGTATGAGFTKSAKCRAAKRQLAERQAAGRGVAVDRPAGQQGAQPGVQAVVVNPGADTLAVGERVQLVATAHGSSGAAIPVSAFSWSSSNDAIASVSSAGLVTATAPGTVVIAANTANVVGTARVMVVP